MTLLVIVCCCWSRGKSARTEVKRTFELYKRAHKGYTRRDLAKALRKPNVRRIMNERVLRCIIMEKFPESTEELLLLFFFKVSKSRLN